MASPILSRPLPHLPQTLPRHDIAILMSYVQASSDSDSEIIGVRDDTIEPLQVHKDSGSSLDSGSDYQAPSLPDGTHVVPSPDDRTVRVCFAPSGSIVIREIEDSGSDSGPDSVEPSFNGARVISNSYNDQDDFLPDASLLIPNPVQQTPIRGALIGTKVLKHCNDGWVITANNTPPFWVPPGLQSLILHPHNTLAIGSQGSVHLIHRKLKLGERWSQCYTPC